MCVDECVPRMEAKPLYQYKYVDNVSRGVCGVCVCVCVCVCGVCVVCVWCVCGVCVWCVCGVCVVCVWGVCGVCVVCVWCVCVVCVWCVCGVCVVCVWCVCGVVDRRSDSMCNARVAVARWFGGHAFRHARVSMRCLSFR